MLSVSFRLLFRSPPPSPLPENNNRMGICPKKVGFFFSLEKVVDRFVSSFLTTEISWMELTGNGEVELTA